MNNNIKPAIVVFPASNCEKDLELVLREVFNLEPIRLWHMDENISSSITHLFLPGGFSFGDYVRAGTLAARSPIMRAVKQFSSAGKPLLGICNGFQILCEAQLLPGVLLKNAHDKFVCKVEPVTFFGARKPTEPISLNLPIAHREGRYFADDQTLLRLKAEKKIALVYNRIDEKGNALVNGACDGIAGIIGGPANNILGLMPHPERMARDFMMGCDGRVILRDFLGLA